MLDDPVPTHAPSSRQCDLLRHRGCAVRRCKVPARARGLRTAVGALRGVTKGTAEAGALSSKINKYANANA